MAPRAFTWLWFDLHEMIFFRKQTVKHRVEISHWINAIIHAIIKQQGRLHILSVQIKCNTQYAAGNNAVVSNDVCNGLVALILSVYTVAIFTGVMTPSVTSG